MAAYVLTSFCMIVTRIAGRQNYDAGYPQLSFGEAEEGEALDFVLGGQRRLISHAAITSFWFEIKTYCIALPDEPLKAQCH
jgi:hypothetical protein